MYTVENVKVFDMRNKNVTLINEPTKEMFNGIPFCIQHKNDFTFEKPLCNVTPIGVMDYETVTKVGEEFYATVNFFEDVNMDEIEFFNYSFKTNDYDGEMCTIDAITEVIYRYKEESNYV